MRPKIHWIDLPAGARLAIIPRPRAGDWLADEIADWRAEGIGVIVSLLEAGEVEELGLRREAGLCHDLAIEFITFPWRASVNTRGDGPRRGDRCAQGKAVAVHCRAGIGRSSLIAASVLLLLGIAPETAFDRIGKARGVRVPDTEGQRDWVDMFHEATKTGGIHPA